ncbi:DUF5683 domain-containing protein [Mucilaginibacter koreensis]
MYKLIFTFVVLLISTAVFAQQPDTAKTNKTDLQNRRQDSITSKPFVPKVKKEKVYHPDSTHLPHTAVMRSLKVPGWGQVYNHQWWKVPLIYGGLGALAYFAVDNYNTYKSLTNEAKARRGDAGYSRSPEWANVPGTSDAFLTYANGYSRNYQLSILGFAAVWGVNIIDAYIQAKFQHSYSMDNNLGMKITPGIITQPLYASNNIGTFTPVLKVTFTLK